MPNDQCDCPKWGVSCMVITETKEGTLIRIDESCMSLEMYRQRTEQSHNLKHILPKGGVINEYDYLSK
jgi:hypothetical protein